MKSVYEKIFYMEWLYDSPSKFYPRVLLEKWLKVNLRMFYIFNVLKGQICVLKSKLHGMAQIQYGRGYPQGIGRK